MAKSVSRQAFENVFGYGKVLPKETKKQTAIISGFRALSYIPFVGGLIPGIIGLILCSKKEELTEQQAASRKALLARSIINLTPAAPLLLPVDIIATIMKHKKSSAGQGPGQEEDLF